MNRRRLRSVASILVLLIAAAYTWWDSRREPAQENAPSTTTQTAPDHSADRPVAAQRERKPSEDGLDLSDVAAPEQEELRATITLVDAGGPLPYRKDGTTFRNAEKKLPKESSNYYREYTVKTPGSRDRGARRIVAGRRGELYYTNDHYRSFIRIRNQLRD